MMRVTLAQVRESRTPRFSMRDGGGVKPER
ncbi:hypothetical protein STANM309S_04542 [Streptomyces tanashiensis]